MSNTQVSSTTTGATRSAVKAPLLIPGRGDPIKDAILVFSAGKIDYAGPQSDLPSHLHVTPQQTTEVPVLLPGLWDCHVHFIGHLEQSMDGMARTLPFLAGARSAHDVAATLNAGFTSVRETAGWGAELSQEIEAGRLIGPNIYSVCAAISCTGGHVDHHTMPEHHFHELGCHGVPLVVADGVPGCIKVVRQQLRRGAKCIKICTSGGVSSDRDDPTHQQFSDEEIRAMVEEAARSKRALAAHAHGHAGIMAAVRNGATTVEHGTYLDDEAIALMKEKGTILVPTRGIIEDGLKTAESWSIKAFEKLQPVAVQHANAYRAAVAAGVKIASGSDYGISKRGTPLSHGHNGRELELAVEVGGMTPMQAIEAATATAPEVLGPQAPLAGILKEGYDADFIALTTNPLEDISIIADPDNVTHVWLAGQLKKSPERPILILSRTKE
jgi:imidazolonepropionase-like amidohydrolase